MLWSTVLRAATALSLFAAVHSLLAALPVKRLATRLFGARQAAGLYRFGFTVQSLASVALLLGYLWRLPDQPLYRVRRWPRVLMLAGQMLSAATLTVTSLQIGIRRFLGVAQLQDWRKGRDITPTPPAQHPLPTGEEIGWAGPYRLSCHPNNYFALGLIWLSPVMTLKWATVGLVTAAYMVLGSMHEDRRLRAAYGDRYDRYQRRVARNRNPFGLLQGRAGRAPTS